MNAFRNFASLGVVVSINLGLQFLFQIYVVTSLGANTQTDALFGAIAVPQFILVVLSGSLTMVLVPLMAKSSGEQLVEESWNYFQAVGLLFTAIAVVLMVTANRWVAWILPGFKGASHALVLNLARIQVVTMVFSALLSVVWNVETAKGNFLRLEFTFVVVNIISLGLLVLLLKPLGVYAVAWISVLRVLLQVLFHLKAMGDYRRPNFRAASYKITWNKLRPLMVGNAYYQTDPLVDRYLTSMGSSGQLTLLNLAQQLYITANSVLLKMLVNTMIPEMAKAFAEGDIKTFNHILKKRLLICFTYLALSYSAMVLIGQWFLGLVFSFKNFRPEDVHQLWWLLVLLAGYFVGDLMGNVSSGAFFAKGDTVTPTRIGTVLFTLYIPIKIGCYLQFGLAGLAICASTYHVVSFMTKLFFLREHLR